MYMPSQAGLVEFMVEWDENPIEPVEGESHGRREW